MHDRARAHRARLKRDVELAAGKPVIAERAPRVAQRGDLGMGGRIARLDRRIAAAADDRAVANDDRADRDLAARARGTGERQRFAHQAVIGVRDRRRGIVAGHQRALVRSLIDPMLTKIGSSPISTMSSSVPGSGQGRLRAPEGRSGPSYGSRPIRGRSPRRPLTPRRAATVRPADDTHNLRPHRIGAAAPYSHSMVAGGLLEMSYTTRLMPRTSLMIRFATFARMSCGSGAQCAVMKSVVCTARSATTCS